MSKSKDTIFHKGISGKIIGAVILIIFALYTLSIFFALIWTFFSSLKSYAEFWDFENILPKDWLFSNYVDAIGSITYNGVDFAGMFVNCLWFSAASAFLSTFMHTVTGYVFAKYKFRGKEAGFAFVLFTLTIPIVGSLPSLYSLILDLKINDSFFILLTSMGGFGSNFLIMYAFFKNIDSAFAEAAEIDGAGHFGIFWRIMIPFAFAPMFAITLLVFISQWNNYEFPILFMDRMPTLSSGLYRAYNNAVHQNTETLYLAAVMMSIIPVLLAVIFFGGVITKNVTMGGVKG